MDTFGTKLRHIESTLAASDVFFGHGYESAHDEAVALMLAAAKLPAEQSTALLAQPFPVEAEVRLSDMLTARCDERQPVAYILGEAWLAGVRFLSDSRALVPRSPIAQLLTEGLMPWWTSANPPRYIVDVCCGGGSLGIVAATYFPQAAVLLSDLDSQALSLAAENVRFNGLESRVCCLQADLLAPLGAGSVDVILSNPPYVSAAEMRDLPAEYDHEPRIALEAEADGTALALRVLRASARLLTREGLLVLEVGETAESLERSLPRIPFTWVDLPQGGSGVAAISAQELRDWSAAGIL
jgi:ribosomal protein L3 glutamine methyltransferase